MLLLDDPFGLPAKIGYELPGMYIPPDDTYAEGIELIAGLAPELESLPLDAFMKA